MNARAFLTAIFLGCLVSLSANAQPSPDDAVTAEALFAAGRADVERGDYTTACPKFAESQRLDPAPGTLINLADCEEHVGHLARAWVLWRDAFNQLKAEDERRPVVAKRVETIDKRVPRLTLELSPNARAASDVRIRRDDVEVPPRHLGVVVPVDPGPHVIVVDARGFLPSRTVVNLAEGASQTQVLDLGPRDPASERPPPPPPPNPDETKKPSPTWVRVVGWSLVGTGVAGLGTSAVTGLAAIGKKDAQEKSCFPIDVCLPEGAAAADSGRTLATVSTVTFIVGAVALAAGVYLVLTTRSP